VRTCGIVATLACGVILGAAATAAGDGLLGIAVWGYDGIARAREWVGPDGRLSQQTVLDGQPSAWDIWPSLGERPTEHAASEITLHRRRWDDPCVERLSLAAMATTDYRISIERGNECAGPDPGLMVCFDRPVPGGAARGCPLRIDPDGVYVSDDGGATWRRL